MSSFEARKAKNILRGCDRNCVYYNSKTKELRVTIHEWQDGFSRNTELENKRIVEILNRLSENGMRPKYRREIKRYQGFINRSQIVFE